MSDSVSDGCTKLWEHRRLGMSVEALAVLPWSEDRWPTPSACTERPSPASSEVSAT